MSKRSLHSNEYGSLKCGYKRESITRILVIDDDKYIPIQIKTALKGPFEIVTEQIASKAIQTAASKNPTVILLDLHMPNVDGFEVLRQIKKHPATSRIPVICMSADDSTESRVRSKNLGATGFIKKPLNTGHLLDEIKSLITSMNITLETVYKRGLFTIAYNESEKYQLIKKAIKIKSTQSKIVLLSWIGGETLFDSNDHRLFENDDLVYLKLKYALITAFPDLQDFSPIISDIKSFLKEESKKYILIFDEPSNILNLYNSESSLEKATMLWQHFFCHFKEVYCFCTKTGDEDRNIFLNQIALGFIGYEK